MATPFIISITGAYSGSGKTSFAERLLARLEGNWGAIKYTKTAFYTSITDAMDMINQNDKDTARLLHGGAKRVLWVQSPFQGLKDALDLALGSLPDLDGIVIEGNSPIEFFDPDIIIFIFGKDPLRIKESAKNALEKSSLVICQKKATSLPHGKKTCHGSLHSKEGMDRCVEMVLDEVKVKKIEKRLMQASTDGRIPCALARRIAEELNVAYKDVGEAANRLKIKIIDCQLGCF